MKDFFKNVGLVIGGVVFLVAVGWLAPAGSSFLR